MKPTEAYSAGIYPHLYAWMDWDQVTRNREKWRVAVERLGPAWIFLRQQERIKGEQVIKIQRVRP
jgi:hypothetical protein